MVLVWVEVYGVDACWGAQCVGENVVACGSDGENDVVRTEFEEAVVDTRIFPGEGIDVFVFELLVLLQLVVIVDSPVVVLVEERWQRQVCGKIDDCRFESLGSELRRGGSFNRA